jgi:hypothetical protein
MIWEIAEVCDEFVVPRVAHRHVVGVVEIISGHCEFFPRIPRPPLDASASGRRTAGRTR